MEQEKKYILFPCSGRARLNISRGHVYHVKEVESKKYIGFVTKKVARKKYGDDFFLSDSDSLCPICSSDIRNSSSINLLF